MSFRISSVLMPSVLVMLRMPTVRVSQKVKRKAERGQSPRKTKFRKKKNETDATFFWGEKEKGRKNNKKSQSMKHFIR